MLYNYIKISLRNTIAGLIGLPTGYWIGLQFLNNYAYHISIGFGTLTFGLGTMLFIGLPCCGNPDVADST